jgi:hypothetical protein
MINDADDPKIGWQAKIVHKPISQDPERVCCVFFPNKVI